MLTDSSTEIGNFKAIQAMKHKDDTLTGVLLGDGFGVMEFGFSKK
jgi:hypothetical protein